ncbi:hypothetical protein BpHYR1_048569 [Brachionus plicatilis]|uniref:Uncharacterized protein n=1 Tax=Brachionus plicatilis TaxID=10195 RepID=A0A3M7PWT3_BRAPC|nr:hypothetical protein BpHYR1_048569 [Brachionus plicatilis]
MCQDADRIGAHTTYKLTWLNIPILTSGTTDKDKSYQPFGILNNWGHVQNVIMIIYYDTKIICILFFSS